MHLETLYTTPDEAYSKLNNAFYNEMWKQISADTFDQSKLKTYHSTYNYSVTIPDKSICLRILNPLHNRLVTKYISSSHDLENEKGRWKRQPRGSRTCKQCSESVDETISHFIFECNRFQAIHEYHSFSLQNVTNLYEFFKWEQSPLFLHKLHVNQN